MNSAATPSSFPARLAAYRSRFDRALDAALPPLGSDPAQLHEAMRYTCNGGKRLRALLVYAAGEALGLPVEALDGPAVAVELIHAYSLVHDDLPAMDDDDLRRGQPTVHKVWDDAMGVLVGDALQTLAFVHTGAWLLPLVTLAWLVWRLDGATPQRAALLGWCYGTAWIGAGCWPSSTRSPRAKARSSPRDRSRSSRVWMAGLWPKLMLMKAKSLMPGKYCCELIRLVSSLRFARIVPSTLR